MARRTLFFFIGLQIFIAQAFALTLAERMELDQGKAPPGFILTQDHLDALNALVEDGHCVFGSQEPLSPTMHKALHATYLQALTPEEIHRAGLFKPPLWYTHTILSCVRDKTDHFLESYVSILRDCFHAKLYSESVAKHLLGLSETRLTVLAASHFQPFLFKSLLDKITDVPDERLPDLARFYASFFQNMQSGHQINNNICDLLIYFQWLSPAHMQCVTSFALEELSYGERKLLLENASSFSPDVLALIPDLFPTHLDMGALFMHLKRENPSRERLTYILTLPRFLQARYFTSNAPPTAEEEALILELLQDTDEHRSVGVLREKNPTTQELISLASLQLPSSFRPCAMRAKDFIPLAAPDPMRLELFLALVEGCPPTDADIISSSLSQSSDIERLRAFRDLNVPPHIRSDLIACYMSQELLHERVPLMLTFLSNYSQKDQQRLCDYYKARLSRLSEEELTFLTKTQLPYAVLDAVFGWCSKISIEQLTIIKAMTEAYEPSNYPYTIDQIFHSSEEIRQLVMTDIYENLQSIKNSSSPASSTQETQKDLDQRSNVG